MDKMVKFRNEPNKIIEYELVISGTYKFCDEHEKKTSHISVMHTLYG